jgi:anti-sigma regulatory factor (Ser/Thr protein kinase)
VLLLPDTVTVRIPSTTGHIGLVRATATAVAAVRNLTYDRIMDLHIAIDEVGSRIMATSEGLGVLSFSFQDDGTDMVVIASGDGRRREEERFLGEWSEAILNAVVDKIEVDESGPRTVVTFRISQGVNGT